jgi:hypothetical protein
LSEINLVLPTEIVEEIIVDAIISSNDKWLFFIFFKKSLDNF